MGVEPDGFEMVKLNVEVMSESPKAYLVSDGIRSVWIPKSQSERLDSGKVFRCRYWLAKEKGLV